MLSRFLRAARIAFLGLMFAGLFAFAGAQPVPPEVKKLIDHLSSKDHRVRAEAILTLGRMQPIPSAAAGPIAERLTDKHLNIQMDAAQIIPKMGRNGAVALPKLLKLLASSDPGLRDTASGTIGKMGEVAESAVPEIGKLLSHRDPGVRVSAAETLELLKHFAASGAKVLVKALQDGNSNVRLSALKALGNLESLDHSAILAIADSVRDPLQPVRQQAAEALGRHGSEAVPAVPALLETLAMKDDARFEASLALQLLGPAVRPSVPKLVIFLFSPDPALRSEAAEILGRLGAVATDAIPRLKVLLKDKEPDTVQAAAKALGELQEFDKGIESALAERLEDGDESIRVAILSALGKAVEPSSATVSAVARMLGDKSTPVRKEAAICLGKMGKRAVPALPALIRLLSDSDESASLSALAAIDDIYASVSAAIQEKSDIDEATLDLAGKAIGDVNQALESLQTNQEGRKRMDDIRVKINNARSSIDTEIMRRSKSWYDLRGWPIANWILVSPILIYLAAHILRIFVPLTLLRVNDWLHFVASKDSNNLIAQSLGLSSAILGLILLRNHKDLLDAWVESRASNVTKFLKESMLFKERRTYVETAVSFPDGERVPVANDFRQVFAGKNGAILLYGEGGAGKTTLLCQIALWAMSDGKAQRLIPDHRMLPLFIEEVIHESLIGTVGHALKTLTGEDEVRPEDFVVALLKNQRIILMVDGISEREDPTRKAVLRGDSKVPVNALAMTSRVQESVSASNLLSVKVGKLKDAQIAVFVEGYLRLKEKGKLMDEPDYYGKFDFFQRLVAKREVTALFAALFAEYLIQSEEQIDTRAPRGIPDLVDMYIERMYAKARIHPCDLWAVHRAARAIARRCLNERFVPLGASAEAATKILRDLSEDAPGEMIKYLIELTILEVPGWTRESVRFQMDPICEYLAARHLIQAYEDDLDQWDEILSRLGANPPMGFLVAVVDTCRQEEYQSKIPSTLLPALTKILEPFLLRDAANVGS